MSDTVVAALYKFVALPDFAALRRPLWERCQRLGIKGTLLLAPEGINGTVAGSRQGITALLEFLRSDARMKDLEHKESTARGLPFERMKVRLKREIVTLGVANVDPSRLAGRYVRPADWNRLLADPDVVVVDVRNDYEVALGTFKGALNPRTKTFRELPAWLNNEPRLQAKPKVAMFCTGGIRCEKSTALLRSQGFAEVYHLQGGILKYLETVPEEQSLWEGECFVFDERVSVRHGLQPSLRPLCRACQQPLSEADLKSELYVPNGSCPACFERNSETKKNALRERRRQWLQANQREDQS
jgi:UPF0176 protein